MWRKDRQGSVLSGGGVTVRAEVSDGFVGVRLAVGLVVLHLVVPLSGVIL